LLSIEENGYAHFFVYSLDGRPILRLTDGAHNDITPSLSPDGERVAFASNRSGFWDLYLLTLSTGEIHPLTNTPAYDAAPTWSPDGRWLAYETYDGNDLEIAILSVASPQESPILLTDNTFTDLSPAWAPQGRTIAFVSDQSGNPDIWLADLDRPDDGRFTNLSNTPSAAEREPRWAGERLLWIVETQDIEFGGAYLWDANFPQRPARRVADADWAAWNPQQDALAIVLHGPNQEYLTASSLTGEWILPLRRLPGPVHGLLWLRFNPQALPLTSPHLPPTTPTPLWTPAALPAQANSLRRAVVPLPSVQAPYPHLHDDVDEAFAALRQRVIHEAGWDALASLKQAYVPLTVPLDPGMANDWLYTGRAFALNPLLTRVGWLAAVPETIGQQTYWRVFLRTEKQDGSQGMPLRQAPWDLDARYRLDPQAYNRGGAYAPVPPGYWVDFTALARAYGWERLPALPNWRVYFAGARFTEFVFSGGLDWYTAMLELYPPEALITPTPRLPPTATPTITPSPTATKASRPSPTPTP